jgi:ectoine hydroxylase-related dioxygenase (phytanoyl-CoA dioxygenase family)
MSSFRNFFDTFGYAVARNAYDKNLVTNLRTAYDAVVSTYTGKSIDAFLANPVPVTSGVEMSAELLAFVQSSRILPIVELLLGDDAVFWGSDLSTFRSGSQFHRDALGDYWMLKVGIYLQDSTAQDGGQFCCIPGSQHFGDRYSLRCSQGLRWPQGAGYAENVLAGDFDFNRGVQQNNIPALGIDLAVGDVLFFNQALIHAVPASNRPRRMIALSFFEGEKSFNSRSRVGGEFAGLTYSDTLIALRVASYLVERKLGRDPPLNYHENLGSADTSQLRKFLREFTADQLDEINARVFKNSYETAYRFVTKSNPA